MRINIVRIFHIFFLTLSLYASSFFVLSNRSLKDIVIFWINSKETTALISHSELISTRANKGSTSYYLEIQYEYVVADKKFTGNQLRPLSIITSDFETRKWKEQFLVGRITPVFYSVSNPHFAVLIKHHSFIEYVAAFTALCILWIMFYLFLIITVGRLVNVFLDRFINE
jgi:Protein of unknown function (DUF3592)